MSPFEYFFGFYSIVLGLSVVEMIATFYIACAIAALASRGRIVVAALAWLIVFSLIALAMDALAISARGGWSIGGLPAPA